MNTHASPNVPNVKRGDEIRQSQSHSEQIRIAQRSTRLDEFLKRADEPRYGFVFLADMTTRQLNAAVKVERKKAELALAEVERLEGQLARNRGEVA